VVFQYQPRYVDGEGAEPGWEPQAGDETIPVESGSELAHGTAEVEPEDLGPTVG
jgi:hypothetical protein